MNTCDIYSTILEYVGVPRKALQQDGLSLKPVIEGEEPAWRDAVVTECSGIGSVQFTRRMIRT